jgi:hypothetical protein
VIKYFKYHLKIIKEIFSNNHGDAFITPIIMMLISLAINIGISLLTPKPHEDEPESEALKESNRGHLVNTKSTSATLPLIYGKVRVGLNIIYQSVSGVDNSYLHMVGTISEGEIKGIYESAGVDQIFINGELLATSPYVNNVYYEVFTGTPNQIVCSTLNSACTDWTDTLKNTAYIYIRLLYDKSIFQNIPDITLIVEGTKVYNPTTLLTEYSNNPALCTRDFLIRSGRRGGLGISEDRIDDDSVIETATYCTVKGWTIGLPIEDNKPAIDNLTDICNTYRGNVVFTGKEFKIFYKDINYESVVMTLTEDDVIFDGDNSTLIIKQPSIFDTPNAIRLQYLDSELDYQLNDFVKSDVLLVAADGDYREETVVVKGINSSTNAEKMSNYFLERYRINKTVSHVGVTRLFALQPNDLIYLTHSIPGWTLKLLRVANIGINEDGLVKINYIEEDEDLYDDTYNLQSHTWKDTTIINPQDDVASVTNVVFTEEIIPYRTRSFTRLKISFSSPTLATYPFWDYAQVWVKVGENGTYSHETNATSTYIIDPALEGQKYYIKLVSINIWGATEGFDNATENTYTVIGQINAPSDLVSLTAVASGDTVTLMAPLITDDDIDGYEARLGSVWIGGILFAYNKAPIITKSGVRPGVHNFTMSPKGSNGLYSDNPPSASCEVFFPSGYVSTNTWSWDYSTGTFVNCSTTSYAGNVVLKCNHDNDLLVGTWTSPTYDLGDIKTVRVWGDFLSTFIGAGNTWDALFTNSTWNDIAPIVTTWNELNAKETKAVVLQSTIFWNTTVGTMTNYADYFEILAPEFQARYVQVRVTITDNTQGSNLFLKQLNCVAACWS